ncbi:MAG: hypothetical protein H8E38_13950 [SAR324 cluster bacterium]|nr:hypothetical protein [SAR324 cluster bacterium]MBL7035635.1 hypothetical protein [SAR324 cluster bacterium]
MKIIKKIIFAVVFLIFEFYIFQFSWQIGVSTLVLITATVCIWLVLKRITTVVTQPELSLSSAPFRDSEISKNSVSSTDTQKPTGSANQIAGVDAYTFEEFGKKFNLSTSAPNASDSESSSLKLTKPGFVSEAYDKAGTTNEAENFSEELDEVEQVKVTLSSNAKSLQTDQTEEEIAVANLPPALQQQPEHPEPVSSDGVQHERKLGAGEEALEILSRKHQAQKKQTEDLTMEPLVEFDDDLFADELIQLSGTETLAETEQEDVFDNLKSASPAEMNSWEDDSALRPVDKTPLFEESTAEAEALLKLATTACEAGRLEEAKAGLESYLTLLNEQNLLPSQNVMHLAERLGIELESKEEFSITAEIVEPKTAAKSSQESTLHGETVQTDYASVMDGIVKTLEDKNSYGEALPLLHDLLNYNRQRVNISAMDPLYDRIEEAHRTLNNNQDLVATYKEHLAIKQQLDDVKGELKLLDSISTYYAETGDQKASDRYQAESLRIQEGVAYKKGIKSETAQN